MKKTNKTKRAFISISTLGAVVTPTILVISCGTTEREHFNLLPTYTGQADQLIALGINADYYPLQLNEDKPYGYLTNPEKYMVMQDKQFQNDFKNKLNSLIPNRKGESWWNQDALASDESGSDPSYWQEKEAGVLLYEHYLLDDDRKVISSSIAPKANPFAAIQTNFRSSRDPYTRIPKGVFYGWDLNNEEIDALISGTPQNKKITINNEEITVTKEDAKIIKALRQKRKEFLNQNNYSQKGESDWLYNDWYFVDSFHRMFLYNKDLQSGGKAESFSEWILDSTEESPFTATHEKTNKNTGTNNFEADLKKLFDASTFQKNEIKGGIGPRSTTYSHHPIYEQQEGEIGAAPMFEGAMRDNQLYLFNVAWQVSNLVNYGTPYGRQHLNSLPDKPQAGTKTDVTFAIAQSKEAANNVKKYLRLQLTKKQISQMEKALDNAVSITTELQQRMKSLKTYFKALGLNNKKFGILTIAPGHGQSTIQSMSKYSFVYKELGFAQPIPTGLDVLAEKANQFSQEWKNGTNRFLDEEGKLKNNDYDDAIGEGSLFNMDDNGWYWTMGETGNISQERLERFKSQFDLGVITARDENYNSEIDGNENVKNSFNELFSSNSIKADNYKVDYDLWNEGLKTPFVMHMILDQIQKNAEEYYLSIRDDAKSTLDNIQKNLTNIYKESKSWGNYFTKTFLGKK